MKTGLLCLIICLTACCAFAQAPDLIPESGLASGFEQIIEELDFRNTHLKDVVRIIGKKYGLNLFIDDAIDVKVTLHLTNVSVKDALDFMVGEYGLSLQQTGNILKLSLPEVPAPPPKAYQISLDEGLLTVELEEEDLQTVVKQLSDSTGKTILADRNVSGKVSANIIDLPFDEAISLLFKTNGFNVVRNGNAYVVRRAAIELSGEKSAANMWVQYRRGRLDVEATQAPLKALLNEISAQTGINFFMVGEPPGNVNANIKDMSLEACLDLILMESDFTYRREGDLYLIGNKSAGSLTSSKLLELSHLKVDGVIEILPQSVMGKAELKVVPEHNALLVNGSQDVISQIEQVLEEIDKPIPQVFFEALVVDYTMSDSYEFGVQAGLNSGDTTRGSSDSWIPGIDFFWNSKNANKYLGKLDDALTGVNIGTLPDDFFLRVKALESVGKANIRSRPQISTLNGHTAELKVGETRYFKLISETPVRDPNNVYVQTTERFQTVDINISLRITPWVSASGEITVEIYPEFNTPGEQLTPEVPPNIQSRSLSSTVRLHDGETIVLGGLIQEIESENRSQVPILGRIPLLGRLFSNRSYTTAKSELVIYVTPHLTYADSWLPGS